MIVIDMIRFWEDFDKNIDQIKEQYHYMQESVDKMRQTLEEWKKDDEIQKLNNRINWIYNHALLTNLSDKELDALDAFRKKHYDICCGNGTIKSKGNHWIYDIGGCGFGHIIKITCPECGETEDVTDIDNW
jgi:predicted house-cleaning noncanonical NTP pyrophosphatase (MazG superfamily)